MGVAPPAGPHVQFPSCHAMGAMGAMDAMSPLRDLHQCGPSWATPERSVSKVPSLVPLGSSTPGEGEGDSGDWIRPEGPGPPFRSFTDSVKTCSYYLVRNPPMKMEKS